MHKLFLCNHCGNITALIENAGVPLYCCGEKMHALTPESAEGAPEKHIPKYTREGNEIRVCVGENAHPMTEEHHISFVALETDGGVQYRKLSAGGQPEVVFPILLGEQVTNIYAYCNLHGLWQV